jgi:hypothetical protein
MTPLERAVAAIEAEIERQHVPTLPKRWDEDTDQEEAGVLHLDGRVQLDPLARAVIEAIREPSSEMTHAAQGESHVAGDCEVDYHGIWASMIDQLLAEGGK